MVCCAVPERSQESEVRRQNRGSRTGALILSSDFRLLTPDFFNSQERELTTMMPRLIPERSEEHTSELQSRSDLVCRLLLEKKKIRPRKRSMGVRRVTCVSLATRASSSRGSP